MLFNFYLVHHWMMNGGQQKMRMLDLWIQNQIQEFDIRQDVGPCHQHCIPTTSCYSAKLFLKKKNSLYDLDEKLDSLQTTVLISKFEIKNESKFLSLAEPYFKDTCTLSQSIPTKKYQSLLGWVNLGFLMYHLLKIFNSFIITHIKLVSCRVYSLHSELHLY